MGTDKVDRILRAWDDGMNKRQISNHGIASLAYIATVVGRHKTMQPKCEACVTALAKSGSHHNRPAHSGNGEATIAPEGTE